jgi:hypothetical protein
MADLEALAVRRRAGLVWTAFVVLALAALEFLDLTL